MNITKEVQEYPNKPLNDVLMDKLINDDNKYNKTFTVGL
jgi:hypothetical protein